jgi:serine/threonine-protein kinase HipA
MLGFEPAGRCAGVLQRHDIVARSSRSAEAAARAREAKNHSLKRFDIVIRLEDGTRAIAGVLAMGDPAANGRYNAEFRYAEDWLKSTQRFALDPESLPLSSGTFSGFNFNPPLSVFNDAQPDRWGRALLLHGLPLSQRTDERLVALRGRNGLGCIEFIEQGIASAVPTRTENPVDLDTLLDAAEQFEAGLPLDDEHLRRLLAAGTTAGGARPKATVHDDTGDWIVKFPSKVLDGRFDVVGLEKASMDCARAAGMPVPDTRIIRVGRKKVIMVRRFDVTNQGGRRHMISLSTLCKERLDFRVSGYDDLADAVRKHSLDPIADLAALFKHAVFNGLLGNTDDHLKNFSMLHGAGGYRLSSAYDLLPDINMNQEHVLFFGDQRFVGSRTTIIDMARRWGVVDPIGILQNVLGGLSRFAEFAQLAEVPGINVGEIQKDLARRARLVTDRVGQP